METPEQFANHPQSVTELKADRSQRAEDWTPRDALITALRRLDSGEISPDALVIAWREKGKEENVFSWLAASPDLLVTVGLFTRAAQRCAGL